MTMTVLHGLHHRYYARQVGTYAGAGASSQFPRGHQMAAMLGQAVYCLDAAGNPIACGSGQVMATLPALPGGGQNIQTAPPTATTAALPPGPVSYTSMLSKFLPYLAGGLVLMLLLSEEHGGRRR